MNLLIIRILPPTILGLMFVAITTLGSPPMPSSFLWKETVCESNMLSVTITSLLRGKQLNKMIKA